MKLELTRSRAAAAALVAVAALLWPLLGPADRSPAADTDSYPLLYDPGPSHDCWGRNVDDDSTKKDTAHENTSGCGAFAPDKEFQRDMAQPQSTPTWDEGTLGWGVSDRGATPGYSFSAQTGAKTVTMVNNAAGTDCGLRETNIGYTYQNSQLRWGPDRRKLTLGDGQVNVSYDATVHQTADFTCPTKRAILTTDFIFDNTVTGQPAVLSVVHYDAENRFSGSKSGSVLWDTLNSDHTCDAGYGCRVMVKSPTAMLGDGQKGSVADDVSGLFDQYADYLNPQNLPKDKFSLRGLQIVSSNEGGSTTASVSDIDARLTPGGPAQSAIRYSDKNGPLCLDDTGNQKTYPADVEVYSCNGSDAQNWDIGWDNTLRVNGLCLDAEHGDTSNGTNVILWQCNGGLNQQWVLGRYGQIYNPVSGRCLEAKSGGAVQSGYSDLDLYDCWGGTNQKWWTPYGDFHDQ
ncbi:ricin-type beta-trefoil lectin domain protein [Streptomyces sp. AM6-12]|uniref:ricin-type beta-trefoil lectin domain protein n=1 Tax=Streptomyces sp. AM6-12 TaxID=3345149 RepID=UPI0037B32929